MSFKINYSKELLETIVNESKTLTQIVKNLGLRCSGANFKTVRKKLTEFQIDTSGLVDTQFGTVKPLEYYLVLSDKALILSHKLKLRLIKSGYLSAKCLECGITDWLGKNLSLHLDHINGNRNDNRLENLRLLCPNCHSQTETYAGKNLKLPDKFCPNCDCKIRRSSKNCANCKIFIKKSSNRNCLKCMIDIPGSKRRKYCETCYKDMSFENIINLSKNNIGRFKIQWPPIEELIIDIKKSNCSKVSKKLGVSDVALKKHLKRNGIDTSLIIGYKLAKRN